MLSNLHFHDKAIVLSKHYLETEKELLELIGKIDQQKIYLQVGYPSLFVYCVQALGLSESQSYAMTGVSRKCQEVPLLREAIESGKLTVSKAKRILPVLNAAAPASEWIEKAANLTQRQVEREVAERNPEKSFRERVRPLTVTQSELRCVVSIEVEKKLERARQVLGSATLAQAIEAMVEVFLQSKDPVEKAKRALQRNEKKTAANGGHPAAHSENSKAKRATAPTLRGNDRNIPASVKHQVQLRDGGQCRHVLPGGERCGSRRHLQFHHAVHFEAGGESSVENLVLLCSGHHRRVHLV